MPRLSPELLEAPYAELRGAASDAARTEAVFITARFRSGSTLLWNLFRHVPGVTAYYEPLNENRWFDSSSNRPEIDKTHRYVSEYWKEYQGLDVLKGHFRDEWTDRHLYMEPTFWDPDLKRYIEILIEKAPYRPVLQFNRVDFRLAWLRRHFPAARIVHLYRHPRDQWVSSLFGSEVALDAQMADFANQDHFYLLAWARDLKFHFPFLDQRRLDHPYELFYLIWKLSYAFGRKFSDYSLSYEELVAFPNRELERLFTFLGIEISDYGSLLSLVERQSTGNWHRYADNAWFAQHETTCDAVLADWCLR